MITPSSVVVVAEEEDFYSAGLTAVLKHQIGYASVLRVQSLDQLLEILAKAPVSLLTLADDLSGSEGEATVRQLRAKYPALRLAVFTRFSEVRKILGLLAAGAHGVILKRHFDSTELLHALRAVGEGHIFVPAMTELEDAAFNGCGATNALSGLTDRQRQVIKLLSQGYPNKVIARELGISPCTVKAHVHAAFRALGVHSRMAAAAALRPQPLRAASRN